MHVDISGMFIGDAAVKRILIEGAAESKTLAAIHFSDNKISTKTRLQIYEAMMAPKVRSDMKFYEKDNPN